MFLSGPAVDRDSRLIRFLCIQIILLHKEREANMYMYIYLCVVQCNGVKASRLSEIWLQIINHFHQCQPLLSASFCTHSFVSSYDIICQKTVRNYYSISSCNRNPVACMFSSRAFMQAPSQRAAISLLPLLA